MYRNKLENQFWWFRRKLCNFLALLSITLLRTFLYFSLDFVPNLDIQCQKQIFLGNRKHMSMSRFFCLGQLISLLPLHNLNIFTNHPYVSRDMSSSWYCEEGMYIVHTISSWNFYDLGCDFICNCILLSWLSRLFWDFPAGLVTKRFSLKYKYLLRYTVAVYSWSIANNFVIDVYCRCLEISCQIA